MSLVGTIFISLLVRKGELIKKSQGSLFEATCVASETAPMGPHKLAHLSDLTVHTCKCNSIGKYPNAIENGGYQEYLLLKSHTTPGPNVGTLFLLKNGGKVL